MAFERNLEDNLFQLREELIAGIYRHGNYKAFRINDPKERQIHKSSVRDRIVHQALVNVIEPIFERSFIYDSYSCRIGKGTHGAVKRLRRFLIKASRNNTRTVYGLKCDIKKFFASVNHSLLLEFICKRIQDDQTRGLLKLVVASFSILQDSGVPLGNLTSQLFANIYLNELDNFIKNRLREKFYIRYCDDFVIISLSRKHLLDLLPILDSFLKNSLSLELHPNKFTIKNWPQGIDFVGYVSKPYCTVLRTKTKNRMLKKVNQKNLSSYLGLIKHCHSYTLRQKLMQAVEDNKLKISSTGS